MQRVDEVIIALSHRAFSWMQRYCFPAFQPDAIDAEHINEMPAMDAMHENNADGKILEVQAPKLSLHKDRPAPIVYLKKNNPLPLVDDDIRDLEAQALDQDERPAQRAACTIL